MTTVLDHAARFDTALSTVDTGAAVDLVDDLLADGVDPVTVLVDVIAAGQRSVGGRWQRGEWSVAQEHAATAVAVSATEAVARHARRVPVTRGRVVVACAEREWHALPAMIIASALRADGWDTTLLGASTPPARLSRYLHDLGPDATAVSCSILGALPTTRRFVEASTSAGIPIVVGGAAFGTDDVRATAIGATAWAGSARDASAVVRGLPTVVDQVPPLPREAEAEQASIELNHSALARTLRERWTMAAQVLVTDKHRLDAVESIARDAVEQGLSSVAAALITGDTRVVGETAAWVRDLLTARDVDGSLVTELGTLLAGALRDHPLAAALVHRHWTHDPSSTEHR